jgi:hypothetical protein
LNNHIDVQAPAAMAAGGSANDFRNNKAADVVISN